MILSESEKVCAVDRLREMEIYVAIVAAGSLSAAARALGLSVPVVSKELARLEERLGALLIQRTTRSLTLTPEGELFHRRCTTILADVDDAEDQAARGGRLEGPLRITTTAAFGRRTLAPLLAEFQDAHPGVEIGLILSDRVLDLVQENIDVAIRFGVLADSRLVARRLAASHRVVCAAPAYVARHGMPERPEDLAHHRCLTIGVQQPQEWVLGGPDGERRVSVHARLSANDGEAVHAWAEAGHGLMLKTVWDVAADLRAGRLVRVLPEWQSLDNAIHAVFQTNRLMARRTRTLVEFLAVRLRELEAELGLDQRLSAGTGAPARRP